MVYIDRNGRVVEKRSWDLKRVLQIFYALWILLLHFFSTLTAPFRSRNREGSRSGRRGGWNSGGGDGDDSGSGGFRPNRRIGRITNSMDCNIPGGGCGSECGR